MWWSFIRDIWRRLQSFSVDKVIILLLLERFSTLAIVQNLVQSDIWCVCSCNWTQWSVVFVGWRDISKRLHFHTLLHRIFWDRDSLRLVMILTSWGKLRHWIAASRGSHQVLSVNVQSTLNIWHGDKRLVFSRCYRVLSYVVLLDDDLWSRDVVFLFDVWSTRLLRG